MKHLSFADVENRITALKDRISVSIFFGVDFSPTSLPPWVVEMTYTSPGAKTIVRERGATLSEAIIASWEKLSSIVDHGYLDQGALLPTVTAQFQVTEVK